ncbi:DUF485 domain-containing protein [Streptomyces sp. NPDC058195]|uniref:DUF485 domain-containing protein n=1 Tax=Streptomyces sp. NPDC058195 TaxID=3346375 RepID=UPI0036F0EFBE
MSHGNPLPSPHHADYLLPWQSSDPAPPDPPPGPSAAAPAPGPVPGRHSDLRRLRTAYRTLRRVATLTALGYFVVFLLLSAFAKDLVEFPLFGGFNVGLVLGLCQLPVTALAIVVYERTARRTVDPLAARVRRAGATR